MSAILGRKLNMTQIWKEDAVIPVTVVEVRPNKVSLIKTKERDGYDATQLSLGKSRREFHFSKDSNFKIGDEISASVFSEGDKVKIAGTVKGRGFQGVVKRHGFHGGPKSHGQKDRLRAPGSIGATAPQRVVPGKKMAGRMGGNRVTVRNLTVVSVDKDKNFLYVKGAVPGNRGGILEIEITKKAEPMSNDSAEKTEKS